jgi:hypothetical protein
MNNNFDLRALTAESWCCIDCGINTAPGFPTRAKLEQHFKADALAADPDRGFDYRLDVNSEVYMVRDSVWKQAGMEGYGGCLCVGCLEKRLGRELRPKDFPRKHPFNSPSLPCTERLWSRRDR